MRSRRCKGCVHISHHTRDVQSIAKTRNRMKEMRRKWKQFHFSNISINALCVLSHRARKVSIFQFLMLIAIISLTCGWINVFYFSNRITRYRWSLEMKNKIKVNVYMAINSSNTHFTDCKIAFPQIICNFLLLLLRN
jgi:hypothetical protein